MATFPALIPSSRTFTPGDYPNTGFKAWSGIERRVRHSNAMMSSGLQLSFIGISEADMLSILSHYQGQQGSFLAFTLPVDAFSGLTAADFTLSGYGWVYAEPPSVEDFGDKLHTVSVRFESTAILDTIANGLSLTVTASLAAGAAAGLPVSGFDLTVTASFAAGAATGSAVTDPSYSSVALLIHADGSNGSTTFTDNSPNALAVTAYGNAQVSTSVKKFGTGSLALDGSGDYLQVPDNASWTLGTGDFTIEAWVNLSTIASGDKPIAYWGAFNATGSWGLSIVFSAGLTPSLRFYRGANFYDSYSMADGTIVANTWYHVAAVRDTAVLKLYFNGTRIGSISHTTNFTDQAYTVRVGNNGSTSYFTGNMDDIRITKGVARYTGTTYTVPTAAFPDS